MCSKKGDPLGTAIPHGSSGYNHNHLDHTTKVLIGQLFDSLLRINSTLSDDTYVGYHMEVTKSKILLGFYDKDDDKYYKIAEFYLDEGEPFQKMAAVLDRIERMKCGDC